MVGGPSVRRYQEIPPSFASGEGSDPGEESSEGLEDGAEQQRPSLPGAQLRCAHSINRSEGLHGIRVDTKQSHARYHRGVLEVHGDSLLQEAQ